MGRLEAEMLRARRVAALCVGNEMMGDDGAGTLVARQLGKTRIRNPKLQFCFFEAGTTPENFTGPIARMEADLVVLIDAADMGRPVGEVAWLEPESMGSMMHTTHNMPLSFLADYIRRTAGARVVALGIQAARIDLGTEPSREVAESCRRIARAFGSILERMK